MRFESFLNELKIAGWEDADEYREEIYELWRTMFPVLAQVEEDLEDAELALIKAYEGRLK